MVENYKSKYDTVYVTVEGGNMFLMFLSIDNSLVYIDGVLYVRNLWNKYEYLKRKVIKIEVIGCKLVKK